VQCEIADEFIRSYKEDNNEFLIETHSEHLLLRIMKRMRHTAEGKKDRDKTLDLTPDDVCLLYVNTDGKSTWIEELELDEDGSLLDPWPNGFFEEGHRERFE
jgi:predicted ATPase